MKAVLLLLLALAAAVLAQEGQKGQKGEAGAPGAAGSPGVCTGSCSGGGGGVRENLSCMISSPLTPHYCICMMIILIRTIFFLF